MIDTRKLGVFLSLILFLGSLLLLVLPTACASPHQTYVYVEHFIPDSLDLTLHPGDHLSISWTPSPESISSKGSPDTITIGSGIIGPFRSIQAAMASEKYINPPTLQVVSPPIATASSTLAHTDSWSSQTCQRTINFPRTMHIGYYLLVQVVETNGRPSSTSIELIKVAASVHS